MATTLLSINNYFYARGGAEIAFLRHNALLEDEGWSIVPFSMRHPNNEASDWSGEFVDELEFGTPEGPVRKLSKGLKAVYSFEARRKLGGLIDRVDPDICHAHNIYHHISPSILGMFRARGIPLVMTLHDLKIACPAYSMLSHDGVCERCRDGLYHVALHRCMKGSATLSMLVMVESYLHRLLGSYTKNVDRFVVPSRFYIDKLVEWGFDRSRFVHIPNFVDAERFEPRVAPGRRFVYFGRLSAEKGIGTLVRAAALADVGLDIIGSGPMEDDLHRLSETCGADVVFHGDQSGDALYRRVASARAVVVPSEWYENAPLSVLEAGALGKPVLTSNLGGLPELIVDGESGWTFEHGSEASLAGKMRDIAATPDPEIAAAGVAARNRVAEHFSAGSYRERIRGLYEGLGVKWH
jgi:glycosyltransferase involved in cell wall biosynthesis